MSTSSNRRQHVSFIVPPHVMEHVALHAQDPALRQRALHNLTLQGQLRGMRQAFSQIASAGVSTGTLRRTIYDAKHKTALPGHLVRGETQAGKFSVAVSEAYDYSGDTYHFYREILGRNSVDNKGMRLDSTVHYDKKFDNAFWNGQQMVYGDGDGVLFDRFTKCLDVIGHELTHGVTQFTARLDYQDQPGALNESMSDVFGCMVKQYTLKQDVDQADWLIGAGLLIPKAGTVRTALRSMAAPGTAYDDPELGKDPQPARMADYYGGTDDNGGVHINSGIPNHAFYLAAKAIGGKSWEVAGKIWYEALTHRLHAQSQFADAATATRDIAKKHGQAATKAVDDAWKAVGL
jgi:Zn-dependent metalloprotease